MRKVLVALAVLFSLQFAIAQDQPGAPAAGADADALVAQFNALQPPQFDPTRKDDRAYVTEYRRQMMAAMNQRADLAKQIYDAAPDHPEVPKIMEQRWQSLAMTGKMEEVNAETTQIIEQKPDSEVAKSARFARAQVMLQTDRNFDAQLAAAEEFIGSSPEDPRGGELLVQLASWGTDDASKQLELLRRVQNEYPNSRAAKSAAGKLRQAEGVGKPFELAFTDAISGQSVDMKNLRGKVVVVDFWATWCGPCVADMPNMKQLYSEYKDKGVEFIGVSLDQPEDKGGLDALKTFVAENDIQWPQYYQGRFWESEFSKSWGIDSIPALFVVDAQGNLHSTNARGKLEQMIPELLAKRNGKAARTN